MAEVNIVADLNNGTVPRRPGSGNNDDDLSPPDPFEVDYEDEDQNQPQGSRRQTMVIQRVESNSSRPREATELGDVINVSSPSSSSTASISSGEYRATPRESIHEAAVTTSSATSSVYGNTLKRYFQPVKRFWSRNITLIVPQKGNRDYFALERTFLAYMRTSVTFSMQGVLVAQIFRLRTATSAQSATNLSLHSIGIPLSVAYQACAILLALMGAFRFWRQQNAISRGKVLAGGWELQWIGLLTISAELTLFILAIAIAAESWN